MRYSIVHHDVREEFGLSLYEYIVCDSIHQLSHSYACLKSNTEIADFLGIDRANLGRIKERLIEMGLIETSQSGYRTTKKWWQAVTERSVQNHQGRARSTDSVLGARHSIYKEDKELGETEFRVERITEETPSKAPSKKKYPNAPHVFKWFSHPQPSWMKNTTELEHAEFLFFRGETQVKKALAFYKEYKDERFCPQITKPSDLERKWDALFAFSKKVI